MTKRILSLLTLSTLLIAASAFADEANSDKNEEGTSFLACRQSDQGKPADQKGSAVCYSEEEEYDTDDDYTFLADSESEKEEENLLAYDEEDEEENLLAYDEEDEEENLLAYDEEDEEENLLAYDEEDEEENLLAYDEEDEEENLLAYDEEDEEENILAYDDEDEDEEYLASDEREDEEQTELLASCAGGKCPRQMVERLRREKQEERARKNGLYRTSEYEDDLSDEPPEKVC
jgi:hypothetical protein